MLKRFTLFTFTIALFFNACSGDAQKSVTLDEMIGEMLMIGFKGFAADDTSHIVRDITEYHVGGVILFDYDVPTSAPNRNIESASQVVELNRQLQELGNQRLLIAVDQEGGRVARLKPDRGFREHRSAGYLGNLNSADSTRHYARSMADQLSDLGFNVNFAPVVDLNTNPENPIIGQLDRSFSEDPEVVVNHSQIFLDEFSRQNILGVIKHFPGHGSAWNDSHVGMADVTDTWNEVELEPYRSLVQSDSRFAVMTAHVFNEHLDDELPATLSHSVQTGLLRDELGYNGVLFSDDMQMDAIRAYYGLDSAIKHAINAGVDILVFANNSVYDPDIAPEAVRIIKQLIQEGDIEEDRIRESYQRIMALKRELFDEYSGL
jgi:beta-N-acetylhexosaminidase